MMDKYSLAEEILELSSNGAGLFFFTNFAGESKKGSQKLGDKQIDKFWTIKDSEAELFSRLASIEATKSISHADEKSAKPLYPWYVIILFRFLASAGACGMFYQGSWPDMFVAGSLAVMVANVSSSSFFTRQERILSEVVAGLLVGVVSGLIALTWQEDTCFGAMALGGVLDIMQGFRAVYSVVEIMSRHTVAGAANTFEGIIFTALISYFLRYGQNIAALILSKTDEEFNALNTCTNGVSEWYFFLLVPVASLSWSGLFSPHYDDLFPMMMHGIIAFATYFGVGKAVDNDSLPNFVAAMAVTLSAGIVSRSTGRQALGNTIAGLYVLLPGAYLIRELFSGKGVHFIEGLILNAVTIGIGAWTGTILCSPTLLGTTRGMLYHTQPDKHKQHRDHGAMLYF
uniref:Threonine/serine exporter-like N-terminal domain-containing protein n=1 Tax=Odontella aurita TaxID=265563 RepID=A0A7S4MVF3_9STRA